MKSFHVKLLSSVVVLFFTVVLPTLSNTIFTYPLTDHSHHCTVFTIAKGGQVFFGGNDDYIDLDSYYWVDQGDSLQYGVIWIGTPDNVQQGINEAGLAYDANGLPRYDVNPHMERIPVPGSYTTYPIRIMQECATVVDVVSWIKTHQWHSFMHDQMQFADTTGDAVIISAGRDGEIVFTRKSTGDGFLVSTNFNVANPKNGYGYPCWRYETATEILNGLVDQEDTLTLEQARDVLDAVHVESVNSWTKVSFLADLTNGKVYIYYFHQYDHPLILDVSEEIENPRKEGSLSMLFPDEVRQEAQQRYEALQAQGQICWNNAIIWLFLWAFSILVFFIFAHRKIKLSILWIPGILVLGPLALIAWLLVAKFKPQGAWRRKIQEVLGDLIPVVISYFAVFCIIFYIPSVQMHWPLQLAVVFGVPVLLGWIFFHSPLLFLHSNISFGNFLIKRLPHAIITTFLGMAGVIMLAMPLVNQSIKICPILPLRSWTLINWWFFVVMGAVTAGIILFIYEHWCVRRGFLAWSVLVEKDAKVTTQSWKQLWWWILISIAVMITGVLMGVLINRGIDS